MSINVGDKVMYVPGDAHAKDRLPDRSYLFYYNLVNVKDGGRRPATDKDIEKRLKLGDKMLMGPEGNWRLELIGPSCHWPAEVLAVHPDGSVDLSVRHLLGGVTMGCPNVPHDPNGTRMHSYYAVTETADDAESDDESNSEGG